MKLTVVALSIYLPHTTMQLNTKDKMIKWRMYEVVRDIFTVKRRGLRRDPVGVARFQIKIRIFHIESYEKYR